MGPQNHQQCQPTWKGRMAVHQTTSSAPTLLFNFSTCCGVGAVRLQINICSLTFLDMILPVQSSKQRPSWLKCGIGPMLSCQPGFGRLEISCALLRSTSSMRSPSTCARSVLRGSSRVSYWWKLEILAFFMRVERTCVLTVELVESSKRWVSTRPHLFGFPFWRHCLCDPAINTIFPVTCNGGHQNLMLDNVSISFDGL